MDRLERFYKIDQLLQDHKVASRDDFLSLLEVSLATFKRDPEYMRQSFTILNFEATATRHKLKVKLDPNSHYLAFGLPSKRFTLSSPCITIK